MGHAAVAEPEHDLAQIMADARAKTLADPLWFTKNILRIDGDGWTMDPWQEELIEAVFDVVRHKNGEPTRFNHLGCNQITVRSMHGPGKTFGLAALMHTFGFVFNCRIPCTAPKRDQLKTRLWPEFRKIYNRAIPEYRGLLDVGLTNIKWIGEDGKPDENHIAFQETASKAESLAGLHNDYLLLVADEATGIAEHMWPTIFGAISVGKVVILVMISNPTKTVGTFADSHLKADQAEDYYRMHISLDKTSRVSRKWVESMERKYGADSPVVKIRCKGEFADGDDNQLIALGWIDDARNSERQADGSIPELRISADIADGGADFSVFTVALEYDSFKHFLKQDQHSFEQRTATDDNADAIERIWERYKRLVGGEKDRCVIVVDSGGVGTGVASRLILRGFRVVRFMGGEGSDNNRLWKNRRTQSYLSLRDDFRDGRVRLDEKMFDDPKDWDDFIAQLSLVKTDPSGERAEEIETKKKLMSSGVASPDRADSMMMNYSNKRPEIVTPDVGIQVVSSGAQSYDAALA